MTTDRVRIQDEDLKKRMQHIEKPEAIARIMSHTPEREALRDARIEQDTRARLRIQAKELSTDRVKLLDPQQEDLKKELDKVDWSRILQYGFVMVQVRNGKPVTVIKEETVKLD